MMDNDTLERLAALEHEQWAHWTQYMLDNLSEENIKRWRRQVKTAYKDLSEREKESDRVWARKTEDVFKNRASIDLAVHHGTCDGCRERNCLVAHYGYEKERAGGDGFRLCTKCLGRGLLAFQHPLTFKPQEQVRERVGVD